MIRIFICFLTLSLLCGCKHRTVITASSDGLADVEVTAQIRLDITLPGTAEDFLPPDSHARRFIVEVSDINGVNSQRAVIYRDDIESTKVSEHLTMYLPPREHTLTVWSDYVTGTDDLLYDTSTLSLIVMRDPTSANDNAKDAFSATTVIDLRPYAAQVPTKVETDITIKRAVGRYELLATDADAFRRGIAEGNIRGTQFSIRLSYDSYLACGYNCIAEVRKELFTGITYTKTIPVPEAGTYEQPICFDYCLCAPGEKIELPIRVEVVNEYNETVALNRITVPLVNGMNTVVKGRFLTGYISGGVGIDTSYDAIIEVDLGTISPQNGTMS